MFKAITFLLRPRPFIQEQEENEKVLEVGDVNVEIKEDWQLRDDMTKILIKMHLHTTKKNNQYFIHQVRKGM